MTNQWDYAKELTEKHSNASGGLFVRLANDGDKVVGIFLGDPHAREVHWGGDKYVACSGDECPICKSGKKPSLRVTMNFYVPEERSLKVIEGGVVWFKDLLKIREKYGLSQWQFEVQRHGEAGSSKTTYTILPEEKIDGSLQSQISNLELNDLEQVTSGESTRDKGDANDRGQADHLIDPHVASGLIPRLKAMPQDAVAAVLAKFEVNKIRDIKASRTEAVLAFVDALEAKYGMTQGTPAAKELDPFAM